KKKVGTRRHGNTFPRKERNLTLPSVRRPIEASSSWGGWIQEFTPLRLPFFRDLEWFLGVYLGGSMDSHAGEIYESLDPARLDRIDFVRGAKMQERGNGRHGGIQLHG